MKKTPRIAARFAAVVAATALVFGSMSAPVQAKDSGWGVIAKDSGWGAKAKDSGWG